MSVGSRVLGRYAAVLDAVAESPNGLILAEVIRATGLPRGTAHRLINALLKVGFIEQRDNHKIYLLGSRLIRLLHLRLPHKTLADLTRPPLEALARRFGQTAFLAKLDGDEVETAVTVMPESGRHGHVQPGRIMPLHAAASAKAIFAFQDDDLIERALGQKRVAYTPKTLTKRKDVLAELRRVRRNGHASCLDELDPGVTSYACPVRVGGAVIYSVGLVGFARNIGQFPVDAIIAALRDAADDLGDLLSGTAPAVPASTPPLRPPARGAGSSAKRPLAEENKRRSAQL